LTGVPIVPIFIFSSHRLNSSRRAVGAVIDLTKAILANQIGNGAALFRPAGINAEKDRSFNGEFFNSIAAGAKYIRHGYSHHRPTQDNFITSVQSFH